MDSFVQKASKYISDNPKFIMVILLSLIVLIIWLFLKSNNIMSNFSSKKDKLKKDKNTKEKDKEGNSENNKNTDTEDENKQTNISKKNNSDPVISQLVKDINLNS